MFTHCVFFWLKDGTSEAEKAELAGGLRALLKIPAVGSGSVGTPAATDRPVVERSYTFGLMTIFKDLAGHDEYQTHPIHKDFLARFSKHFAKVSVYDFEG
jgi:hypothetical protein